MAKYDYYCHYHHHHSRRHHHHHYHYRHPAREAYMRNKSITRSFITSAPEEGEWSTSRPSQFIHRERRPVPNERDFQNRFGRYREEKNLLPYPDSNNGSFTILSVISLITTTTNIITIIRNVDVWLSVDTPLHPRWWWFQILKPMTMIFGTKT